ncbi:MAG: hypothetical protein JXB18_09340 [Sedimentisphaerales bacterium]|nr:hypothetical protein [Sedimentisphaerales bacterium]
MRELHLPHFHRTDWHSVGTFFNQMIHASWFWPAIILLSMLLLLIALSILAGSGTGQATPYPVRYPFMP